MRRVCEEEELCRALAGAVPLLEKCATSSRTPTSRLDLVRSAKNRLRNAAKSAAVMLPSRTFLAKTDVISTNARQEMKRPCVESCTVGRFPTCRPRRDNAWLRRSYRENQPASASLGAFAAKVIGHGARNLR